MKYLSAPLLSGFFGVLLAAVPAVAQVPFSSTAPPSPFNRFNSGTSGNGAAQPNASQGQPGQYPYPGMTAMPGAPVQAMALNAPGAIDANHRLTRGDCLSYRVAEDRDDKLWPLVVQDSGDVEVPLIGRVKAVGKTTSELTGDIRSKLLSEYYKNATVSLGLQTIAAHSNGRVFITGELAGHGALDLPADGQLTVSQAILQMGGPTDDSSLGNVRVVRKGISAKGFIEVNVKAVLKGEAGKDFVLQPGDTVVVKKNLFGIKF